MKQKEIIEQFPVKKYKTQIEFDSYMNKINIMQTKLSQPYNDRLRNIEKQKAEYRMQINAIIMKIEELRIEQCKVEQERKDINRTFYDIKHELIMLNPKEEYTNNNQQIND